MQKQKKKSLVIQKNDPRKGGRKSHLKENARSIVPTVTATLILTQTLYNGNVDNTFLVDFSKLNETEHVKHPGHGLVDQSNILNFDFLQT